MKFCKCGAILIPVNSEIVCKSCGHKEAAGDTKMFKEEIKKEKPRAVREELTETLPTEKRTCPKCGHHEAYFWTQQTRGGDEAETQFYKCKKCGYSWRKY